MFLPQSVLYFVFWVEIWHNDVHVTLDCCRPNNRLALSCDVFKEFLDALATIDAEIGIVLGKFNVMVMFSEGCQQVSLLVGSKRVHEGLVHLENDCQLIACRRLQQLWFIFVAQLQIFNEST